MQPSDGVRNTDAGGGLDPRGLRSFLTVFLLLALCAVCLTAWLRDRARKAAAPPILSPAPVGTFVLQDQLGASFNSVELHGKVWVANFIFSSCTAGCPLMADQMRSLHERVVSDSAFSDSVRLLSFSVDPRRDKPERLREFATRYGADTKLWRLLTGGDGEVVELSTKHFQLSASQGDTEEAPTHSDRFGLVDAVGYLRGYYRLANSADEMHRLLADIDVLVEEAQRQ